MPLKLSMTCGRYDRSLALIDGRVKPEGIDLEIDVLTDDRLRQSRSRSGGYDVAEFFAGTYMADLPSRSLGLTAIPIFVKRMFRHSYIYINKRSGIRSPADLNGKRVGVQQWFTTTALWARALLAEDYGVDLSSIQWVAERKVSLPDWSPPSWLKLEYAPEGVTQEEMLFASDLDVGITTETWAPGVHEDVDFLFPNYAELEREYYKRTGFFPIMHLLVIKTAILEKHPWVARSLFDAWQASKEACYAWLDWQRVHQTALWYRALWEEERAAAGGRDIYLWGFQKTRAEVDKMLEYAVQQGMLTQRFQPEDMFHSSTLDT